LEHSPLVNGIFTLLLETGPSQSLGLEPKWIGDIFQIEEEVDPIIKRILDQYPKIIFIDETKATKTNLIQCKIWMKNQRPIRSRPRPLSPEKKEYLKKEIEELLSAGVIVPSKSPYISAPVLVRKKDGSWRLAIDYRWVNDNSEDFPYPLPRIDKIFDQFYGVAWFSTLDLARGY